MNIRRSVLKEVIYPYAVSAYQINGRPKVITATELDGPCTGIWADTLELETIWEDHGGTMNTCQLDENGTFLAIQRFYKGFQSRESCIVKVEQKDGVWTQTEVAKLPFIHRFCTLEIGGETYLLCCLLCADKASKEDWSQPGRVVVAKLPSDGKLAHFQTVLDGIHKNHGLYKGTLHGEPVILVTGVEGLFKLSPPSDSSQPWKVEAILDREISDCTVIDLDGDGQDEIITIEKFHGQRVVVNKWIDGTWKEVYEYPVAFGHAIWSGTILGAPAFLIGYRASNAALLLFQLKMISGDDWYMDVTVLDEHEGPTNIDVVHWPDKEQVFSCSGARNRIVLYELTK